MSEIGYIKDLGKKVEDSIIGKLKMMVDECEKYTKSNDIELIIENKSDTDIAFYHNLQNGKLILKILDKNSTNPMYMDTYPEVMLAESSHQIQMILHCNKDDYINNKNEDIPYDTRVKLLDLLKKDPKYIALMEEYKRNQEEYNQMVLAHREKADKMFEDAIKMIVKGEDISEFQLNTR